MAFDFEVGDKVLDARRDDGDRSGQVIAATDGDFTVRWADGREEVIGQDTTDVVGIDEIDVPGDE